MIALFSLLTIIVLSLIVVKIGAIALNLTGLSSDISTFQAQSAFSGVGYTTTESESVVTHPLRRRIIRILMLLGSAGLGTSIATFVLTFIGQSEKMAFTKLIILLISLIIILFISRSKYINSLMKKIISKALLRWTSVNVCDYEQVLGLSKGYQISRIKVKDDSWMAGRSLKDLKLTMEGMLILAVYRKMNGKEEFTGAPTPYTVIEAGDELICYSRESTSRRIAERIKDLQGAKDREDSVQEEQELMKIRKIKGGFD